MPKATGFGSDRVQIYTQGLCLRVCNDNHDTMLGTICVEGKKKKMTHTCIAGPCLEGDLRRQSARPECGRKIDLPPSKFLAGTFFCFGLELNRAWFLFLEFGRRSGEEQKPDHIGTSLRNSCLSASC